MSHFVLEDIKMQSFHSGLYTFKLRIYILHVKHANQQVYKRYICKQFYIYTRIDKLYIIRICSYTWIYKVFCNAFEFV